MESLVIFLHFLLGWKFDFTCNFCNEILGAIAQSSCIYRKEGRSKCEFKGKNLVWDTNGMDYNCLYRT